MLKDMESQSQEMVGLDEASMAKEDSRSPLETFSVDWKGRPSCPGRHGGMKAAIFIMGLQALEIMAIAAVGNNLITYVFNDMHYPLPKSANIVTNFVGTIFLLSILGGFLSDSYLGSFWTIILFGCVELIGYIVIAVQAHVPRLRPDHCNMMSSEGNCKQPEGVQTFVLFLGLYLVAVGSGCLKPNMISHGGDQFDANNIKDRRRMSTYFNFAYLSFCIGELIALTFLVWIQSRCGMDVGFGVSAAVMFLGLLSIISGTPFYRNRLPQGSIFTRLAQVLVAAVSKRKLKYPSDPNMLHEFGENITDHHLQVSTFKRDRGSHQLLLHTDQFRFLDQAAIVQNDQANEESPWKLCTVTQVEQVKLIIRVIPIFACTIIMNCILAQLQTFSVQQGSTMDNRLTNNFHIPPASLQAIPYMMLVLVVPLYDAVLVPFARGITGKETGITQLQRIGVGLLISTLSMVTAALVEAKRKRVARDHGLIESSANQPIPLSIFWIAPQFLVFGLSEMFTAVGMIEFFYSQSLAGMQSLLTALTYCSYSFGFFLSSVLVSIVNKVTATKSHGGWLSDNNLNKDHLDLFYWLLSALSLINFFNYIFWSRWYTYNPSLRPPQSSSADYHSSKVNASTSPDV
eukprot:Gb_13216 [translate_table: standard]